MSPSIGSKKRSGKAGTGHKSNRTPFFRHAWSIWKDGQKLGVIQADNRTAAKRKAHELYGNGDFTLGAV